LTAPPSRRNRFARRRAGAAAGHLRGAIPFSPSRPEEGDADGGMIGASAAERVRTRQRLPALGERIVMYVVQNRIEVPGDGAAEFERAFVANMRNTLAGVTGLRRSALLRPTKPDQPYVATMEFDSADDFMAWMRSDAFKAAHANAKPPGAHAPSAEAFTVVEEVRP
jgi:heme-degrading monooxygenase HmoA